MKYIGMPPGMWLLYRRSFREHLVSVLGCTPRRPAPKARSCNSEQQPLTEASVGG